ncbi:MAG: hypothetical protein ACLP6G_00395 [Terriglobales bacterium]
MIDWLQVNRFGPSAQNPDTDSGKTNGWRCNVSGPGGNKLKFTGPWQGFSLAAALSMAALFLSCGGASSAPISGYSALGGVSVSISPASMTIATSSVQTFTATVANSGVQAVQWQVNGIPGGAAIIGTIDNSGNYTAPQFVPNPPDVVITAVANADNTKSGNASVTITGALYPATVFLSPVGAAYLQVGTPLTLSAGVTGPADTSVLWQVNGIPDGNSTVGRVVPGANNTAVYTAPAQVPNPATVTIAAVSHAEPTKLTSCTVTVSEQAPNIPTVTITPVIGVVQAGTSATFTASVVGASDTSVSWSVGGEAGGDATDGTVAGLTSDQGLYTAPLTTPLLGSAVSLTAISNAEPSRAAAATVTIAPPAANGVTVQLSGVTSATVGSQHQFTATVGNAANQTVVWQVNGITGGNSTYGTIVEDAINFDQGDYTAPAQAPIPPTVVVGARPNADSAIAATLPVAIAPVPVTISLACYPAACLHGTETLGISQQQQFQIQITGVADQNASWYVCVTNPNPPNCTLGGSGALGTISPDTAADLVTYTAPPAVPSPSTVIIKAVSEAAPGDFATGTLTISTQAVSVQVTPPGPLSVQLNDLGGPFTANVIGSLDETVSWYVNNILNGNATVGTMAPDSQVLGEEDYFAPASVPNPAQVTITAVPEAAPTVVSNPVSVTVIPTQQQVTIAISPNPPPPLLPGSSEQFNADVEGTADQIVNWTLTPTAGGTCTDPNPPTPCGSILPAQTNNAPTTYTAPTNPPSDPYKVTITAIADASPHPQMSVPVTITNNATASISIVPSTLQVQAGSTNDTTFYAVVLNVNPDITVAWTLGCNSLSPDGESPCGPDLGHYKDGSGPGCVDYPGGGFDDPLCHTGSYYITAMQQFTYTPPTILGTNYTANNCSKDQTNGWVEISAQISANSCNQTSCTATMCIEITPP